MMTAIEVLEQAADMVEAGWVQGVSRRGTQICAGAALLSAIYDYEAYLPLPKCHEDLTAYLEACDAFAKETGEEYAPSYNDALGRTKEEVVAALRNSKRWLTP